MVTEHCPEAGHSSGFSICFARCSACSGIFYIVCCIVELMDENYMVPCRHVDKYISCDHALSVRNPLCVEWGSTAGWHLTFRAQNFLDEVSFNNWSYSVKYQYFIELLRVTY